MKRLVTVYQHEANSLNSVCCGKKMLSNEQLKKAGFSYDGRCGNILIWKKDISERIYFVAQIDSTRRV